MLEIANDSCLESYSRRLRDNHGIGKFVLKASAWNVRIKDDVKALVYLYLIFPGRLVLYLLDENKED